MIEVSIDSEELRQAQKLFADMPKKLNTVIYRSTKRLGSVLASEMARQISQEYYLTRGDVRKVTNVHVNNDSVTLRLASRRLPLHHYRMAPKTAPVKRRPAGYLRGAVRRGNMHKFSRGFVMNLNGYPHPMMRIGKGRYHTFEGLKMIIGPSPAQLADNRTVLPEVIEKANAQMLQQMRYWTQRELQLKLF